MLFYWSWYKNRRLGKGFVSITVAIPVILLPILSGMPPVGGAFCHQQVVAVPFNALASPLQTGTSRPGGGLGKGKFLIANRHLKDPNFSETVVILIDYDPRGVIGLVINRPTDVKLSKVLPEIEGLKQRTDMVFMGGPVGRNQMLLLIRSGQHSQETHHVFEDVYASSSMTVLKRMIDEADAEERFRAYIGYAGWSPGQLDREVSRGDWNVWRADAGTIFDKDPSKIWSELIHQSSVEWVKREEPGQNILFFPKRPKIYPIIGYIE